jgi:hypothetical protein
MILIINMPCNQQAYHAQWKQITKPNNAYTHVIDQNQRDIVPKILQLDVQQEYTKMSNKLLSSTLAHNYTIN